MPIEVRPRLPAARRPLGTGSSSSQSADKTRHWWSFRPERGRREGDNSHWWSFPDQGVSAGKVSRPLCPCGQTGLSRPRIPFRHPGRGPNQCAIAVTEHRYSVAVTAEDPQPRTGADPGRRRRGRGADPNRPGRDADRGGIRGGGAGGGWGDGGRLTTEHQPDLVILDVKMPKLDGLSAAEKIASERIAPVLMLTAFSPARPGRAGPRRRRDGVPGETVLQGRPVARDRDRRVAVRRAVELEREVADLAERLESRKPVDRAKWPPAGRSLGLTEPDSFRWIQKTAMDCASPCGRSRSWSLTRRAVVTDSLSAYSAGQTYSTDCLPRYLPL